MSMFFKFTKVVYITTLLMAPATLRAAEGPDWSGLPDVLFTNAFPADSATASRDEALKSMRGGPFKLYVAALRDEAQSILQGWEQDGAFMGPGSATIYSVFLPNSRLKGNAGAIVEIELHPQVLTLFEWNNLVSASLELASNDKAYAKQIRQTHPDGNLRYPEVHARFLGAQVYRRPHPDMVRVRAADSFEILDPRAIRSIGILKEGTPEELVVFAKKHFGGNCEFPFRKLSD